MASSSSSSAPRTWKYRVFTSFHGPDARKAFLSHLRKQFSISGISMFDDQGIERGEIIAPALTLAIRESRISIVVLSKYYASSKWCLDELVEIFKCKEEFGQIVMTVFYEVDPSEVRKQTGEFGRVFNKTCAGRTEEDRRRWSQALTDAGNIAGEHNWDNESKMTEKIARDVSKKLNTTVSKDFEDMVGIEAHLEKMMSLLHLENEDEALIVGIFGPAGIGKTTIARALCSRLCSGFQLSCFMENVSGNYDKGLDDHGLKLSLQEKLLPKILNQNGMRIYHLGAIPERLHDQRVLIILDDVDDLEQLEALAYETSWFGPGSRIIVTTNDQEILEQHDINITYYVDFPTNYDARKILCKKAFGRSLAPDGFEKLVERATKLCANLPLGLSVIGSTLRGKKEEDWECILQRLENNSLNRKIERVLRVGYENLHKSDQLLFLLIAFFFNYEDEDHVKAMVVDCNLDEGRGFGLKILVYRSLIQKSTEGKIVMHKLLQQVGREALERQDPGKRQILIDANEICDVFEKDIGSRNVIGISLDISTLSNDVSISSEAFKKFCNLRFFNIYKTRDDTNVRVHVPEEINFPSRIRLLNWENYPRKCLPPTFSPEFLVELILKDTKLEKLWEGNQPLVNLKKMSLENSIHLKELPDLSSASNLEKLDLSVCTSLVGIPSSVGNLIKLKTLYLRCCLELEVVPTHLLNFASLESVNMFGCCKFRKFPEFLKNITKVAIVTDTMLQDFPESIRLSSRLQVLDIFSNHIDNFSMTPKDVPDNINWLKAEWEKRAPYIKDIEKLPNWIKDLHGLQNLRIMGCPKLASLPELPASLRRLAVINCDSLETLMPFPSESAIEEIYISNCLKLGEKARRVVITQQPEYVQLPGGNVPAEYDHRVVGNSLIIPSGTGKSRICVVVSPKQGMKGSATLLLRVSCNGFTTEETQFFHKILKIETEHLFIRRFKLPDKLESDVLFEFSTTSEDFDVIECGFQIMDETSSSYKSTNSCIVHGRSLPAEFEHQTIGNSLTIPSGSDGEFNVCVVVFCKQDMKEESVDLLCRQSCNGFTSEETTLLKILPKTGTKHLCIFRVSLPDELENDLLFEFNTTSKNFDVIECGFQILTDKTNKRFKWKERPLWHQDITMGETSNSFESVSD